MNPQDETLLARARQGDVEAFASLFEAYRPAVFAVALRLAGPDEADDVTMNTFLKAWQAVPRFEARSAVKTWLYRIAHNCALDALRARRRRPATLPPAADGRPDDPFDRVPDERTPAPDRAAEQQDLAAFVGRSLARLPAEHRAALELRFADGLSYAEIAAATGVSIGTVMSRLFYGKRKLQRLIAEGGRP